MRIYSVINGVLSAIDGVLRVNDRVLSAIDGVLSINDGVPSVINEVLSIINGIPSVIDNTLKCGGEKRSESWIMGGGRIAIRPYR